MIEEVTKRTGINTSNRGRGEIILRRDTLDSEIGLFIDQTKQSAIYVQKENFLNLIFEMLDFWKILQEGEKKDKNNSQRSKTKRV
jgi:hypothetical protein